jgi:hypothetical protein
MNRSGGSRIAQFRLIHGVYVVTLLACSLATFGIGGIFLATPICILWGWVFTSRSRPRALANICSLLILLAFCLFVLLSQAMGYSSRSAVRRMTCANHLKEIALALHNYHDAYGTFPPAYVADSNGRPMHSWRVLLLPFLEEKTLYEQYAFDEPWDGPNNRQLLPRMPQVYACPSAVAVSETGQGQPTYHTSYVAVVGPTTVWPGTVPRSFSEIRDGTSNTALLIEIDNSTIPWLEPRDLAFDAALAVTAAADPVFTGNHRSESFFYEYAGGRQLVLVDGSVRYVSQGVGRHIWAGLFGVDDGIPWSDEDLNPPEVVHRRLQIGNCVRLSVFVFLALLPLPWVWLNPTSKMRNESEPRLDRTNE